MPPSDLMESPPNRRDSRHRSLTTVRAGPLRQAALVALGALTVLLLSPGPARPAATTWRVLVLKATWGPQPVSDEVVSGLVFNEAAGFLQRASFGRLVLGGDATPWLTAYSAPPNCLDHAAVTEPAKTAAQAAGFDVRAYQRLVYVVPYDRGTCNAEPLSYGSGDEVVLIGNFTPRTIVAHELGHTLGLGHAQARICGPRRCSVEEYGDPVDAMALGTGDFNPLEKVVAGWLTAPRTLTRNGVYQLDQFELRSSLPQALKISTARGEYWVDHREPLGNDANLSVTQPVSGVEVRRRLSVVRGRSGASLTPNVLLSDARNANGGAVPVGETFSLPSLFALKVLSHQSTHVTVQFGWLDRSPPSTPRITRVSRRGDGTVQVTWARSADGDSGLRGYLVLVGGRSMAETARNVALVPRLLDGQKTLQIVAIDRAGNRSRSARKIIAQPTASPDAPIGGARRG